MFLHCKYLQCICLHMSAYSLFTHRNLRYLHLVLQCHTVVKHVIIHILYKCDIFCKVSELALKTCLISSIDTELRSPTAWTLLMNAVGFVLSHPQTKPASM